MLTLLLNNHRLSKSASHKSALRKLALSSVLSASFVTLFASMPANTFANTSSASEDSSTALAPVRVDTAHPVKELAYGEFLFDYYQQKYFTSISKVMIAEKRGLLQHHSAQTKVLLGSLYVDYGMLDEAESIFNELLESSTALTTRNNVWFHLSDVYYKRGHFEKAIHILQSNIKEAQPQLQDNATLLLAQCFIAQDRLKEALELLGKIQNKDGFSLFAKFNLASAHNALDEPEKATDLYHEILKINPKRRASLATAIQDLYTPPSVQSKSNAKLIAALKDRAALALGSTHLAAEQWGKARTTFESIALEGPSSNTALLGLGWSYLNDGDLIGALAPWQELRKRNLLDPAVQEVLLSLPLVYEKGGALQDALDGYRSANQHYQEEIERLNTLQESIDGTNWINSLTPPVTFSLDPMDNVEGFTLPDTILSQHLYQFYASHRFQESFRDYRELQRLKQLLNHWQKQVPIFNQMIESNVERLNKLTPKAEQAAAEAQELLVSGTNQLVEFTQRLKEAIAKNDTTITATDEQMELLERLAVIEANLAKLPDIPDYDSERERFRVIKGVLLWDLNETAIERRWERTKDKVFIEAQLTLLEQRIQKVHQARGKHLTRYNGISTRIDELSQRLTQLQTASLRAILHQRVFLKAIAKDIVQQQQRQLRKLQANTVFAIARLQDIAYSQEPKAKSDAATQPSNIEQQDTPPAPEEVKPPKKKKRERQSLFEGSFESIFQNWD